MKYPVRELLYAIALIGMTALAGCSSFYIPDRTMTLQEILAMSQAGVDADVMIAQIDATHTNFLLTSADLIMLKKSDVPDDVVEHMIETGVSLARFGWEDIYDPIVGYPYYLYYPFYRSYYSPYHSTYYSGASYRMYHPYAVTRQPGIVGRFYEYSPAPGYTGKSMRRPSRDRNSNTGGSPENNGSRRNSGNRTQDE